MSRVLKVLDEILYKYEGIPPQGFDDGGLATPKRGLVDGPGSYSQPGGPSKNQWGEFPTIEEQFKKIDEIWGGKTKYRGKVDIVEALGYKLRS